MRDADAAAVLLVSPWEAMARRCAEHEAARREYVEAEVAAFVFPGDFATVRLEVAEVALRRAEGRLETTEESKNGHR